MSIQPENIERGVAARFRQPLHNEDFLEAQALECYVRDINCVNDTGPRLSEVVFRNSYNDYDLRNHVFRWDSRDYRDIFINGFQAWPLGNPAPQDLQYYNLLAHVNEGGIPLAEPHVRRAFVSTTLNPDMRFRLNVPVGTLIYRYEIYAPGGILVQETLGDRYNFVGQREIAFVGGIDRQYIRAAQIFEVTGYDDQGRPRTQRHENVVVINMYFNPQSHPEELIKINRPCCYYKNEEGHYVPLRIRLFRAIREKRDLAKHDTDDDSKAADEISYTDYVPNPESDDPAATLEFYTTDNPAGIIDWYSKEVANLESYIDAAFLSSSANEAYLFMRNEYVLMNYAPGSDKIVSGPSLICDGFPSLVDTTFGEYGIDCGFRALHEFLGLHPGDQRLVAYIFSGNLCAMVNHAPDAKDDKITSGPLTICTMFPFFKGSEFESGIDAAFEVNKTHEAYLFKSSQYARINYVSHKLIAKGPIIKGFPCLRGTIFESGIQATFTSHSKDEAYLFKGKSFAVINFAQGAITNDGVKEIVSNWPSLAPILPRKNKGVDVHDHEHIKSSADDQPQDNPPKDKPAHVHDELK
ncbi:hypothetical protein CDL15_Pgr005544 [Punica granatum]|uniref:Pierisin-like domain-containing protein n=1 Tax=Punica granatum TaxID=22663 RepID=A0A218WW36_PUNGR|nr:hypothetical protein CDL15_Pgr005544 [Punica granatum]